MLQKDVKVLCTISERPSKRIQEVCKLTELIADWCKGEDHDFDSPIYMPDNSCPCGITKHHYHCIDCGGVNQVG